MLDAVHDVLDTKVNEKPFEDLKHCVASLTKGEGVPNFKGFRLMPPTLEAPPGDSSKTALGGIEARFQLPC